MKKVTFNQKQFDYILEKEGLTEALDEATYPDTFNMEEFKNLRNFAERVRYCKSRLKYL